MTSGNVTTLDESGADGAAGGAPSGPPAIAVRDALKVYGPTVALAGANLTVERGEIHGLLGENGSGKSTLVRLIDGLEDADRGEVLLFGTAIADYTSAEGQRRAVIHQDLGLIATMSVSDNIGLEAGFTRRLGLIDERATRRKANELLRRLGIEVEVSRLVGELPLSDQTAVAVARALAGGVDLIVLDEPTAYLEPEQVGRILALLRRLRDEGVATLLITHRASDVLTSCDRVTVLREGRSVLTGCPVEGMTDRDLVRAISGHELSVGGRQGAAKETSRSILELRDAATAGVESLSLDVGAGEVVGLCGLADAGTAEVGDAVFGVAPLIAGEIWLDGARVCFRDPVEAIDAGVAYVPGNRLEGGLATALTARENLFGHVGLRSMSPIRGRDERARAKKLMQQFGVDPPETERAISTFSGGNQQKILLAKWVDTEPKLLILNEPTAGVDLGAKAAIHATITNVCRERGLGVLLISSDFQEVADLADRVYVMHRRRLVAERGAGGVSAGELVELAYGRLAA